MPRFGRLAALGLVLSGAARATPDGRLAGPAGSLPLSGAGRPTLIIGDGARLDSVDPETGNILGSLTPISVPGFTWKRFLRRGRFLLADGQSTWLTTPVRHCVRGLVLIDDSGTVRWSDTHIETLNRASHAVFLDDEGDVAFDSIDGPKLILRDGKQLDVDGVPAGPVLNGPWQLLPVRALYASGVDHWLTIGPSGTVYGDGKLPEAAARRLPLRLTPGDDRWLELIRIVDSAPEEQMYETPVKTIARLPVPPACRGTLRWTGPTMSPRHWMLECQPQPDDEGRTARKAATFVVDVAQRRVRRVRPPSATAEQPPDSGRPDDVAVTVLPDGTTLASVWNECTTEVLLSQAGGVWKGAGVRPPFGPQFVPEMVCGRLTLQPTLLPPNMGCVGGANGPAAYVRRPDGAWRELPYKVAARRAASCSPDGDVVAFIADGALTTARLDRPEEKTVCTGLGKDVAVAWLP